jgi:hypothetical protein
MQDFTRSLPKPNVRDMANKNNPVFCLDGYITNSVWAAKTELFPVLAERSNSFKEDVSESEIESRSDVVRDLFETAQPDTSLYFVCCFREHDTDMLKAAYQSERGELIVVNAQYAAYLHKYADAVMCDSREQKNSLIYFCTGHTQPDALLMMMRLANPEKLMKEIIYFLNTGKETV